MPVTDPIADLLVRVRNAMSAGHDTVSMPSSRMRVEIARLLRDEGYVQKYEVVEGEKKFAPVLRITLKYSTHRQPVIRGLRRASKPGRRIYVGWQDIPRVQGGLGIAILTTSHGVISDRQARTERVGGELLCFVW